MSVNREKIREIAQRVVATEGVELVDVEIKGSATNHLLRITIDKPEGISHQDCQLVSEQVGAILDVEGALPGRYILEVSSPGLDRPLTSPADYQRFTGRRTRLSLREPYQGQTHFEGRLRGYCEGRVLLEPTGQPVLEFDLHNIARAKLVVEL